MKDERLVILPYAPKSATGRELETAVRGWHRFFYEYPRIVVVGERCKAVDSLVAEHLVEHIERPVSNNPDGPEREFASLARFVIERFGEEYPGFVKTDDDIYPVNPFSLEHVRTFKWIGSELKGNPRSGNHFQRAMFNTQRALIERGLPTVNYCSHAPRYYECSWLRRVLEQFDCEHFPHLIEPLYFNCVVPEVAEKVNVNAPGNPLKYGIYGPVNMDDLNKAIAEGVKWVNHSAPYYDERIIEAVTQRRGRASI